MRNLIFIVMVLLIDDDAYCPVLHVSIVLHCAFLLTLVTFCQLLNTVP